MAYVYHCRLAAELYGFSYEEFLSSGRAARLTPSHFKDPVRMEAIAVSHLPPQKLASPDELIFYHMIFKAPETDQIFYTARGGDKERTRKALALWDKDPKKWFVMVFLNRSITAAHPQEYVPRMGAVTMKMYAQKTNPDIGYSSRLGFTFDKNDLDLMEFDNMLVFHKSFYCGEISDELVKEVEFTDSQGMEDSRILRCLALDTHKISIPLEMFAVDICWQELPDWDSGGCFIERSTEKGKRKDS